MSSLKHVWDRNPEDIMAFEYLYEQLGDMLMFTFRNVFFVTDSDKEATTLRALILMSDTFAYACADAEPIESYDDLVNVYNLLKMGRHGEIVWSALKRKRKPLPEVIELLELNGWKGTEQLNTILGFN